MFPSLKYIHFIICLSDCQIYNIKSSLSWLIRPCQRSQSLLNLSRPVQAIQVDATAEDLAEAKSNIEAENEQLEQEVAEQEQELASSEELSGALDDVDTKIEDLTSNRKGWELK